MEAIVKKNIFNNRREGTMKILVTGGTGFIGSHTCVKIIRG